VFPPSFEKPALSAGVSFGLAVRICFRMDSRQRYALGLHSPAIFLPWKQRTSALRRGKDMVYSGKVILKVTNECYLNHIFAARRLLYFRLVIARLSFQPKGVPLFPKLDRNRLSKFHSLVFLSP